MLPIHPETRLRIKLIRVKVAVFCPIPYWSCSISRSGPMATDPLVSNSRSMGHRAKSTMGPAWSIWRRSSSSFWSLARWRWAGSFCSWIQSIYKIRYSVDKIGKHYLVYCVINILMYMYKQDSRNTITIPPVSFLTSCCKS